MGRVILVKLLRWVTPDAATGCWRWTGAMSQSGRRGCFYPVMRWSGKTWRVNRLVLTLKTLRPLPQETLAAYLLRAVPDRATWEASHTCDHSYCVNPDHLQWESHPENVQQQAKRRAVDRRRRQREAA